MATRWPPPRISLFTDKPTERVTVATTGGSAPGGRIAVPERFVAHFDNVAGVGDVAVTIETRSGRSWISHLEIDAPERGGIRRATIGDLSYEAIAERALVAASFSIVSTEGRKRIRTVLRKRVTEERLAAVREAFERGGIAAVIEAEGGTITPRHAKRLKAQAFAQHDEGDER